MSHDQDMAAMPIYGIFFKSSSLEPKGRRPWNLVYSIGYTSTTSSNDDPGLTFTYVTARSKLVHFVFVLENAKAVDFQETIEACEVTIGTYSHIYEYLTLDNPRSVPFTDTKIRHFQTSFPQKHLGRLKLNLLWGLHGMLRWNVQMFRVTWPNCSQAHIW